MPIFGLKTDQSSRLLINKYVKKRVLNEEKIFEMWCSFSVSYKNNDPIAAMLQPRGESNLPRVGPELADVTQRMKLGKTFI